MIGSSPHHQESSKRNAGPLQPGFFDLRTLSAYSCCSVRWLRDGLVDRTHPLPHYRAGGKLLVKRDEFDCWTAAHRLVRPTTSMALWIFDGTSSMGAMKGGIEMAKYCKACAAGMDQLSFHLEELY